MPNSFLNRVRKAWNVFSNKNPTQETNDDIGISTGYFSTRQDKFVFTRYANRQTIVAAIYNKIAIDVASVGIKHIQQDSNGRYVSVINSGLNRCLNVEANIDQTGRAFLIDLVLTVLDSGVAVIFPVETDKDPNLTDSYEIKQLRVGEVIQWYPEHVEIQAYNQKTGLRDNVTVRKKNVAIVTNPFYSVMNEPNSTMKRLLRKLALLDQIDEQSGSGKLDLIIQMPYSIKSQAQRDRADLRKQAIEEQLQNSKHGIAYTDATEKITQLNRPVENNLMKQVEYLTSMLYSQLGLTQELLENSADEQTILNYFNGTIEPLLDAIVDELKRSFLTKTAMTQGQSIMYLRNPFKLVTISQISKASDSLTRNEILSSNELRQIIGYMPSKQEGADDLRNKNLNQPNEGTGNNPSGFDINDPQISAMIDDIIAEQINLQVKEKNQNG